MRTERGGSDPAPPDRTLRPLDVDATPVVAIGTALWALALVVTLLVDAPPGWRWTCLAGTALGLIGLPLARRMQRR